MALVAGPVAGLAERQLALVRALVEPAVVVVPAPAGAERVAHRQLRRRIEHVDPVLAPLHREVDAHRRQRRIDGLLLDVLETAGEVVVPTVALVVVPVVVAMLPPPPYLPAPPRPPLTSAKRPWGEG